MIYQCKVDISSFSLQTRGTKAARIESLDYAHRILVCAHVETLYILDLISIHDVGYQLI